MRRASLAPINPRASPHQARAYFGWIESGDSLGCLDERI
jgi:hypothetical protein